MNNDYYIEQKKNMHLYFQVGESQYAISTNNVLEIMKLPALDYPQKLPNDVVGLLKYNNFVISVIDLRFYLNIEPVPYTTNNELLIVKTDEIIFGIITDKIIGILPFETTLMDQIPFTDTNAIIESLYKYNNTTIYIVNLYAIEQLLKRQEPSTHNIQPLMPKDEVSKQLMKKRSETIMNKASVMRVAEELHTKNTYLSFNLNNDYYCITLNYIKEVLKESIVTRVPGAPEHIVGIMNLRGDYITVLDIKKFLGLPSYQQDNDKNPVIIITVGELNIALSIDKINELFDYHDIEPDNLNNGYYINKFIYNDNLYTILNIEKIVEDKKIIVADA